MRGRRGSELDAKFLEDLYVHIALMRAFSVNTNTHITLHSLTHLVDIHVGSSGAFRGDNPADRRRKPER